MSANAQTVIGRFVARRTLRSATFVALAFGALVASKTLGYVAAYPTVKERLSAAALDTNNAGVVALYGTPHHIETIPGFTVWYALCIGVLLGSIWAYLVATRAFRGEEAAGRWEILLAGQTTPRAAAANALAGLGVSLLVFYAITAATLIAMGQVHSVGFAAGPALYFALAAVAGALMFMALGAFTSQLMPTRARAAGLCTLVFGVSFLMRAAGDITSAHWLTNFSPIGWIERLQPLYDPKPLWLLPIFGLTIILSYGTVILAGRRDLGDSTFRDHDTARPRLALLRGPITSAIRFTRATTASWLLGLAAFVLFFGALAHTAAQEFGTSTAAQQLLNRMAGVSTQSAVRTFLGIAFMLAILIVMAYAASAVTAMRSDEARGYLDNVLVRSVSRQRWLWGRAGLAVIVIMIAGLAAAAAVWLGMSSHNDGISFGTLLTAGTNIIPPAIFTLGLGICTFGIVPRLTAVITYGVIAWSLLIQMLSSGLNLSRWLLDTAIFTHIALSPATDPKWGNNLALIVFGVILAVIGAAAFERRDLVTE